MVYNHLTNFIQIVRMFSFLNIELSDLSAQISFKFVKLTWSFIPDVAVDDYWYEIGFAEVTSDQRCSTVNTTTLPQHYESYTNTSTSGNVDLTGLKVDTCYVFGVRVYSTRTGQPGEWTVRVNSTLPEGMYSSV